MRSELMQHKRTRDCKVKEKEGQDEDEVETAEENEKVSAVYQCY